MIVHDSYTHDRIFDIRDPRLNRDDSLVPYWMLRENLAKHGVQLSTQDINAPSKSAVIIANEMPNEREIHDMAGVRNGKVLLLFETDIIRPDNWIVGYHEVFDTIFTWNDSMIDGDRYLKFNFPQIVPEDVESCAQQVRNKLCVLIAANKSSRHENELYSKRRQAIDWFELHHSSEFDLFGFGWDRRTFDGSKVIRQLNRIDLLRRMFAKRRPSYRGTVRRKSDILRQYRFSICYENAHGYPGYITEKIFDCLFAGCVPIYLGAPNVGDHIPPDAFIDARSFTNYEQLYGFMVEMSEEKRRRYVNAGLQFLRSPQMKPYAAKHIVYSISSAVLALIDGT